MQGEERQRRFKGRRSREDEYICKEDNLSSMKLVFKSKVINCTRWTD